MKPDILTDADIRDAIYEDFSGHGGGTRLARALGISNATASVLRKGGGALAKAAAWYGYVAIPDAPGNWMRSLTRIRPRDVGNRYWTEKDIQDVRSRLKAGETIKSIAASFGMTPKRMREKAKRHGLLTGDQDLHYELGAAQCRLRGDTYGERMIRAEQEARASGGSFSQQLAHMQSLMMSDEDRKRWNDELRELIDAAA